MTNHNLNEKNNQIEQNKIPQATIKRKKRISPFWLLPLIALLIGATLFFQILKEQGLNIQITFNNGEGLVANKTQIRYQGLQIGIVKKVNFSEDLKQVEVQANIYPEAKTVLRENTKFWLVRPNASLAGISGLDTLISGNYITLRPGDGEYKYDFIAETESPIAQVKDGDLLVHLISDDLGSISQGASIYYKKMPVGKVLNYRFTKDQKNVEIDAVINKNYANLVKKNSRFWNISGVRADLDLSGVNINIDSLQAVIQGAITFDSPEKSELAGQNQQYTLYPDFKSAKRGIEVKVILPNDPIFKVNMTEVYYQDNVVGTLYDLDDNDINADQIIGKLLLSPNIKDNLRQNSKIIIRQPKINLANLEKIPEIIRGSYLEIIAGDGDICNEFTAIKENDFLLNQPDNLILSLTAPETYGINKGEDIYYNNISIGRLIEQKTDINNVQFKAVIFPQYRQLIHQNTQFIAASNLDISVGLDGLRMQAANPTKWLQGGIRIVPNNKQGEAKTNYPIYRDQLSAEMGITAAALNPTITLQTSLLPSISKGSLVLYRQYEVGQVLEVRPLKNHFEVDVAIYPKFNHLLTNQSRFWVESAAQIDISPKGISIQATPIARSLKGAISFDNQGKGKNTTLYANEQKAKSAGQIIQFTADDASYLSKGMNLRYMGLIVGEIEDIKLDHHSKKIIATAQITSNYMNILAKENSRFKIISPKISASGIENIDSLLQPYIDVEAGNGKSKTHFVLEPTEKSLKLNQGFPLILETTDASNVSIGSAVMYRGVDVGKVQNLLLNQLGDRVLIHILIEKKHAHLVRQNSQFWISSGYTADLGWSGIEVNTGSMQQLLKGGISFSTPNEKVIQPQAKANQRFLLQIKRPENAKKWNSGALASPEN